MSPDRRTVLKGLGAGGAVVVVGGVVAWRLRDDDGTAPTTTPAPEPTATVGDALVAVGARYLEAVPEEADRDVLLAALPALEGTVPERPGTMLRVLAPQVVADHGSGATVELDGWVLSRTEARAAALYAL